MGPAHIKDSIRVIPPEKKDVVVSQKNIDFIDAIEFEDVVKVKRMLAEGVDVNFTDEYGRTFLHTSVYFNSPEISKILIDSGADVNAKCNQGYNCLYWSTLQQQLRTIFNLSLAGAVVDEKLTRFQQTCLHFASIFNKPDSVAGLLKLSADVTIRDRDGRIARDYAEMNGYRDIVKMFDDYNEGKPVNIKFYK